MRLGISTGVVAALGVLVLLASVPAAAGPGDGLFRAAQVLSQPEEGETEAQRRARLQNVRNILDQIVMLYPDSELAARIGRGEVIDGLDIAALDAELATEATAPADGAESPGDQATAEAEAESAGAAEEEAPRKDPFAFLNEGAADEQGGETENPFLKEDEEESASEEAGPALPEVDKTAPSNPFTEETMSLRRAERREVQRRLALAGFDPGGADGVFGNRTRAALWEWQKENGFAPSGYLNVPQLAYLRAQTEADYAAQRAATPRKARRVKVCTTSVLGVRICEYRTPGRRPPSPSASAPER